MKRQLEVRVLAPIGDGNATPRLILAGEMWDTWDPTFCVHGVKLRWACDWCDEDRDCKPKRKRKRKKEAHDAAK